MQLIKFLSDRKHHWFLCLFGLCLLAVSCRSYKHVPYLRDIPDSTKKKLLEEYVYVDPVIQVNDILAINIQTLDPQNADILNQSANTQPAVGAGSFYNIGNQMVNGYKVDKNGYVELQVVGRVKIKGLSTSDARDLIHAEAKKHYVDPVVQVQFANFKVTVLGEVLRPGTFSIPNENVTIFDALGLAGDLTVYGKRTNVMVVRHTDAGREVSRLNLNSSDVFRSPYFYLKQNDIVYIEPAKSKVAALNTARVQALTVVSLVLSLLIVVATRVNFH